MKTLFLTLTLGLTTATMAAAEDYVVTRGGQVISGERAAVCKANNALKKNLEALKKSRASLEGDKQAALAQGVEQIDLGWKLIHYAFGCKSVSGGGGSVLRQ